MGIARILLVLWLLLPSLGALGADEEESVSLDSPTSETVVKTTGPSPYEVTRNPYLVWIPIGFLALITAHLIAYPFIRIRKQADLNSMLPDANKDSHET